jgi:polyisoprenoid-binding protein YceI
MLRGVLFSAAILALSTTGASGETWKIDPAHTSVGFSVKHLVITTVNGNFTDFAGTIDFDGKDVSTGSVEMTIKSASVDTRQAKRDEDLRSSSFFSVDSFPTIKFKSKKVIKGEGNTFKLIGDMTMKDVTKEVTFDCLFNGVIQDPWGGTRASFTADTHINRQDFHINYSKTLDNGGLVAGNDVNIHLEIEAVKAKA